MRIRSARAFAGAIAGLLLVCTPAGAQTPIKFALDWKFEGPAAPYFVAIDKGYYKAEGLDVTIDEGNGSVEGINRVASGTYPLGFSDINSLIKFRDKKENAAVKAVMMVYDAPAFAIIALRKSGIKAPADYDYGLRDFDVPDLDGNMIFFGMESKAKTQEGS